MFTARMEDVIPCEAWSSKILQGLGVHRSRTRDLNLPIKTGLINSTEAWECYSPQRLGICLSPNDLRDLLTPTRATELILQSAYSCIYSPARAPCNFLLNSHGEWPRRDAQGETSGPEVRGSPPIPRRGWISVLQTITQRDTVMKNCFNNFLKEFDMPAFFVQIFLYVFLIFHMNCLR